jgi:hypothetical protein
MNIYQKTGGIEHDPSANHTQSGGTCTLPIAKRVPVISEYVHKCRHIAELVRTATSNLCLPAEEQSNNYQSNRLTTRCEQP